MVERIGAQEIPGRCSRLGASIVGVGGEEREIAHTSEKETEECWDERTCQLHLRKKRRGEERKRKAVRGPLTQGDLEGRGKRGIINLEKGVVSNRGGRGKYEGK